MIKLGTKKIVNKFAYLPTAVKDKIFWLKEYSNIYEYKEIKRYQMFATQIRGTYYTYDGWELIEKI
jgi:hypothetical protein